MPPRSPEAFRLTHFLRGEPETWEFDQARVVLGRNADCDLVLAASDVSRVHAVIERDAEGWVLKDLNSRFGTFVNHKRVAAHRLVSGDRITLGGGATELEFEAPCESAESPRVWFRAGSPRDQIRMTLAVEDWERSMGRSPRARRAAGLSPAGEAPSPAQGAEGRPRPPGEIPLFCLFQHVGEVLLTSANLDEMLGKVLDLAMENLPAQRGFICLCDEAADNIQPKAVRVKGLARGESLAISRTIAREAIRARQALLVDDAPADRRFALAGSVMRMEIRAAMCAPLHHAGRVEGLIYVDTRDEDGAFVPEDLELLAALGSLTAVGILQSRLREEVEREKAVFARLSRYSSPRVIEQIVASVNTPDGTMLAAQCEVSVLFADLSDFTSLAESCTPAEVVSLLNGVFERLAAAIFQFDGTLDKFLGDGVLGVFGAPVPQADHADRAISAALLMRRWLEERGLCGPRGEPIQMRIGIHSGPVVAGDIGSPLRKDYTVVGDAVNIASRLQSSVARPGQIVVGQTTYELARGRFEFEPLPEIRLKGKEQLVRPYLVVGPSQDSTGEFFQTIGAVR